LINLGFIFHRFQDTAPYSLKLSTENSRQTAADGTWLLSTAYKKLPTLYQMVPSPTSYDLPFSRNTARLAYRSAL